MGLVVTPVWAATAVGPPVTVIPNGEAPSEILN